MKKPETKFSEHVAVGLRSLPYCWFEKIQQQAKRGTPDYLCCIAGHFVALELKKDKKSKADRLQKHKLEKIKEAGGTALVVSPEDWPHVLENLREQLCDGKHIEGEIH